MRELHDFPGGLLLEPHKEITDQKMSILHPLPERMFLPLQQHIGQPAVPAVKIGDKVLKGQIIARPDGYVSVPVHASTSGTITDIGDYPVPNPTISKAPCIVLEPDGNDAWFDIEPTEEYDRAEPAKLQELIRDCGIAGLGGAGFPAHVKLMEGVENAVDTLIINGVECEPHITCDDRLIQEKASYVVSGARMIRHAVQARHCVVAVEDDMELAYNALAGLVDDDLELVRVPTRYPAGGEKQLIRTLTGKDVPSGGLPIHIGIVIHNVATAAAVYRAVTRGEPIVSRYITVTGKVDNPVNLQVLIGTPVEDCLATCGYRHSEENKVIIGGPMMGLRVTSPNMPVIKTTNCIIIEENAPSHPEMPCIRCGDCADVCPELLLPQQLYWFAKTGDTDRLREYRLFDCIECGCCAYVCPSRIPLVHYYRQAKSQVVLEEEQSREADRARQRFNRKNDRLRIEANSRDKARAHGEEDPGQDTRAEKKAYVEEALARTRAKRRQRSPGDGDAGQTNTDD
ncbi:MAG: electron transport complex subunit RsxC [Gammaproteobacteria bacterium]|nr:electron transport complex subunit RsxC [Gammaproteobacteria bacterium]